MLPGMGYTIVCSRPIRQPGVQHAGMTLISPLRHPPVQFCRYLPEGNLVRTININRTAVAVKRGNSAASYQYSSSWSRYLRKQSALATNVKHQVTTSQVNSTHSALHRSTTSSPRWTRAAMGVGLGYVKRGSYQVPRTRHQYVRTRTFWSRVQQYCCTSVPSEAWKTAKVLHTEGLYVAPALLYTWYNNEARERSEPFFPWFLTKEKKSPS